MSLSPAHSERQDRPRHRYIPRRPMNNGVSAGAKPLPGQEKRPTPDCFAPFDPLRNTSPVAHNDGLVIARPDKGGAWQSRQVWRLTGRSRILPPAPDCIRRLSPLTAAGGLIEQWGVQRGETPSRSGKAPHPRLLRSLRPPQEHLPRRSQRWPRHCETRQSRGVAILPGLAVDRAESYPPGTASDGSPL